jgi:hypothetical protein
MFDHICESTLKWARNDELETRCELIAISSAHDMNRKNTALMPRQQIVDEIANN